MRTALSWPVLRELAAGSFVDGVTRAIIHLGNINRAILDLIQLLLVPEQIDLALEFHIFLIYAMKSCTN